MDRVRELEEKVAFLEYERSTIMREAIETAAKHGAEVAKLKDKLAAAGKIIAVMRMALIEVTEAGDRSKDDPSDRVVNMAAAFVRCKAKAQAALDTIKDRG